MKKILIMTVLLGPLNVQALTEQGFVERLRATHPFFNQQALSSKVKLIEKRATKANEDWVIALESLYQSEHKNSGDISMTTSNLDTASIGLSATRKYTNTGSDITLKHTWKDKSKSTDTTNNGFSLDYTYPLLRNKGGINDRLSGDVAQIAINQNTLQRLEAEEGFILGKLSRFIDLAYAQEQQSINERRLALSEKELALVNKKYNASVVEKVDVLLQQDAYQTANQKLLQAQQDLMLLRHEIAVTLDLDFEKVVASTDFYKIYKPSEIALKAYLSKNSRVLKINNLSQKILKRQLLSFKNTAKAKLDLKLGISSAGENTNYSKSLSNQSTTWKVGLGLSYPIGGIEADSNIKKTNIELEILVQSKREQLLDIYTQAKTLKEKIQLLEKMMHANQAQIKIAKARTAEEKQRYSNGNGQASFVINAQNNEQVVKLSYAQVAKNYQKAILEFKASIDQLVP
ncbi:TolC family protein [thiotrophic endosymbiont of Bathymodiolus puteoserpentis (Logatchev)]|uniref:TolC family protein n=1 Tax=thiotrophic endosymbiont of Bathymodiolus puteoserpentis (Logatchev) TaxID=343240 RepID=UPI001FD96E1A|nr:TolC family protein [thiotrophic endosymbiont of Bathymodiolus puteoserpentis (Logatchev)]